MLTESLLIALLAGLAGVDLFDGLTHFHRPVVLGPLVGLVLGDLHTGLLVGGSLELVWMGMVPLAGAQPPNVVIGGVIGTAFAILTKSPPTVAIGVAVPFSIAVQGCITILFTVFSPLMHKCDDMVKAGNWRGVEWVNYAGMGVLFCFYFVVAFLPVYFGAAAAGNLVKAAPQWLLDGLSVAGGMMPAIGFALLMKIMLSRNYVAYFILGFLGVTYLHLPILAIALAALAVAMIDFFNTARLEAAAATHPVEAQDGI
ncbi:PTS N-acetylgalactosamine transporter subunit IIC [Paludibacterium purpuratum]|uniref:PTS system N-acetylgalactosamine-specific EIIC component (Man family) n=1 Tax=Paludibacterium purpuratum TaxID=1144873 RepID=A0A4R7B1H7_9NEIS|nr:PTS N-acetylgalactosamine transporter subunit IIC [Paludibacterium purpuratum]TDR73286.1 PTS system N-acetylgalactosamine-specific EIIC component (Man family) [Paludibacterium purpuratum]